jgi:uncharacterized protein involved in exopolysaccharide biosynthesis
LFKRILWFLLPVVALAGVGVLQAGKTEELYRSRGTLSTSTNPLVPDQTISGPASDFYDSPATATSKVINEQLRTDAFLRSVAETAGLGDALENGAVGIDGLRDSIWSSDGGDTILSVNAVWSDPSTAQRLVQATIDEYQAYLNDFVASSATEAEAFYTDRLAEVRVERDDALAALEAYVADLPEVSDEADRPVRVQLQLNRLTDELDSAEARVESALSNIEDAQLTRAQQMTVVGRSFVVVDEPSYPPAPQSTLVKRVMTVVSYAMMGVIVAIAALVVTTMLDSRVSSPFDLLGLNEITTVATVPLVALPGSTVRPRRRSTEVRP